MPLREVNVLGLETPRGFRKLRLLHGSIADVEADLKVVSTHLGPRPTGASMRALGYVDLDESDLEPLLLVESDSPFGTWRRRGVVSPLILRMPGAEGTPEEQAADYAKAVWAVYSSLAALELHDDPKGGFPCVASVLVGGRQDFDTKGAMRTLLEHACRWLERSRYTTQIDIVEINDHYLEAWSAAMNSILGRAAYDVASDSVISALASELFAHLEEMALPLELAEKVGAPLRDALTPARLHALRVASLSVPGRVLAEAMVVKLEAREGITNKNAGDLYTRIQTLHSRGVRPWIVQHLHALRVYGNEEVHFKAHDEKGKSVRVGRADLPGVLASLLRVVQYWREV